MNFYPKSWEIPRYTKTKSALSFLSFWMDIQWKGLNFYPTLNKENDSLAISSQILWRGGGGDECVNAPLPATFERER